MWSHFHKAMENKKTAIDKILAIFLVYQDRLIILLLLEAVHYLIVPLKVLEYFQNYKSTKGYDDTVMLMASLIKEGIEKQEFKEDIEVISLASFLASSMEGYYGKSVSNDNIHHHYFIEQIKHHLFTYSK